MKVKVSKYRSLYIQQNYNTQNENEVNVIKLQVPEGYEDFNKKIVFITPEGTYWDLFQNDEYAIGKALTKYKSVQFYIWLTKNNQDFRSETRKITFIENTDASEQITPEEIDGVNTVVNLLEEEITKVDNINISATKIGNTAIITITDKNGNTNTVEITDGINGQNGAKGDKGDKGEQGEQGIQGEKGAKGDKGDRGDRGEQGIQGIQGLQGEKGEKGDKGDKGDTGAKGEPGTNGTNGQDGYTPQRGTDYWTASDIASIESYCANYIDANINQMIGGSY